MTASSYKSVKARIKFYDIKSGKVEITKGMQKLDEKLKLQNFWISLVPDLEQCPLFTLNHIFYRRPISLFDLPLPGWKWELNEKNRGSNKRSRKKLNTERVNKLEERRNAIENDTIYSINDQLTFKEPGNEQETVGMFLMLHGAKNFHFMSSYFMSIPLMLELTLLAPIKYRVMKY